MSALGATNRVPVGSGVNSGTPECPVCATSNARYFFTKHGYPVYRCRQCKLEFLHSQPDDGLLASIYDSNYFLGEPTRESAERTAQLKSATAGLYLDRIGGALSRPGARILEVGCGNGELLVQARMRGFQVEGIEYSATAAENTNRRLGSGTVQVGTLDTVPLPLESFDAIVACDVIEHVRDPKAFVRRAYACLRPGGMVFLVTPSLDNWTRALMRQHWMEYKVEHLFYFSRRSLRLLLASSGFQRLAFYSNKKAVSFEYIYHHFRSYPVPLLTPLISGLRYVLPRWALHRQWKIAGSGVIVIAQKPLSEERQSGI